MYLCPLRLGALFRITLQSKESKYFSKKNEGMEKYGEKKSLEGYYSFLV